MFNRLKTYLKPPTFEDEEKSRIATYVHWLAIGLIISALLIGTTDLAFGDEETFILSLSAAFSLAGALWLIHRGHLKASTYILLITLLVATTLTLATGNGIHDIGILLYPMLIMFGSFLLQRRGIVVMTLLTLAATALVTFGEIYGWFHVDMAPTARSADWIIASLIITVGAFAVGYMSDSLVRAVQMARQTAHAMAETNARLSEQTELLRESEERWRALIQNAPDTILSIDREGKILLINFPMEEAQQLSGQSVYNLTPPEDHAVIRALIDQIFENGQVATYEGHACNAFGEMRWYAMRIAPVTDKNGQVANLTIIATDISKRLEYEQTLAQNDQNLRQRARQLSMLNEIGRAVSSLRDIDGVLTVVFERMSAILPLDAFFVVLYNPETGEASYPLTYDSGRFWSQKTLKLDPASSTGRVIDSGQPLIENRTPAQVRQMSTSDQYVIGNTQRISASIIAAPLILEDQVAGVVAAHSYEFDVYTQDHLDLLTGAAYQIAIALQNARLYENVQKRASHLGLTNEIGRAISGLSDLESVLRITFEQMRKILPLDVFYVGLYRPETHSISYPILYDSGNFWQEEDHPVTPGGWVEQVRQSGSPMLINRTAAQLSSMSPQQGLGDKKRVSASIMIAPMVRENRFIGIISVHSYSLGTFTQEDLVLLGNAANQITVAVENARLFQEAKQRAEVMTVLYRLGNAVTSNLQIDGVMNELYESCRTLLPLNAFYIATYDQGTDSIAHPIFYDKGKRVEVGPRIMKEKPGLSGYIISHKQTVYIPDVMDKAAWEKYQIIHIGGDPTRSYLGAPLLYQDEPIGVISVQSDQPNAYTHEHISLLETISTQAAIALVNARLYENLQKELRERQQAEEEVRALNAQLEKRVQERTEELQSFTYTVSHDLRAPLRSINGYSRIFLEEYGSTIPPEGQMLLERISSSAHQMGMLIDDLLTFSRLSRASLNKTNIDMAGLAHDIFQTLTEHTDPSRIRFAIGDLPPTHADLNLMRQALTNLIANALKFSRRRAIAEIELDSLSQGGEVVYFIKDNGAGFNMDHVGKLFGVFQRLHHQDEFEGTGVGLAIVQRIIQYHGGRIWAEAELDKGATFYFTLGPA